MISGPIPSPGSRMILEGIGSARYRIARAGTSLGSGRRPSRWQSVPTSTASNRFDGTGAVDALVVLVARQVRRPPVPAPEQHDHRWHQQGAHEEGVHQDPERQAEADRPQLAAAGASTTDDREHGEGAAED